MEIHTVLLIFLAAIAAVTIVFYQYFYRNPKSNSLRWFLAILRFCALFSVFLLLVNPKFTKNEYSVEKANLIVLVDDSSSMEEASKEIVLEEKIDAITEAETLRERFSIQQYAFGDNIQLKDSLHFNQRNTDIANALSKTNEIFNSGNTAIVLISDGNQTLGKDYSYISLKENVAVYPIVVGDTTDYEDVSIGLVNTNPYAFLRNKFPIEATILYKGSKSISKRVTMTSNGKPVYAKNVELGPNLNSQTINVLVDAASVGVKSIRVEVQTLKNEKNTVNNRKETAVEVIDEKTNVAIISDILHPDIGVLKKSIEANEQRAVTILKPTVPINALDDMDVFIFYQPNSKFRNVFQYTANAKSNSFTIAGTNTDWNFLNQIQQNFSKENFNQSEEILPVLNKAFSIFNISDFDVDYFPPLEGGLGDIQLNDDSETLLFQKIKGVNLDKPLFSIFSGNDRKEAVLFGENIWKWRANVYRNNQNFEAFDDFIGKLMIYLSSNNQRSRLELDYELVFDNASLAKIKATYFDKSYSFDANANLKIDIKGNQNNFSREYPMLLKGSFFEADLSNLEAGEYTFTVTVEGENLKRSGTFKILDFNPEKQLISANQEKLSRLAVSTNGELFYPENIDSLIVGLSNSNRYIPVQKSKQNVVSLIDFKILLGIVILALALEWFIRKYNGLI